MKFLPAALIAVLPYLSATSYAAPQGKPIKLASTDDAFFVLSINALDANGKLCITGEYYDVDETKGYGKILVVDTAQGTILWQKKIPAPDEAAVNHFDACRKVGNDLFVLSNINTDNSPPLNQNLVYVYKFSEKGALLAKHQIDRPTRDAYAYGLDASEGALEVVGYLKSEKDGNQTNSLFAEKLDTNLKFDPPVIYKTGAFDFISNMKVLDKSILIGGNFMPYKLSTDDAHDDYANSKIRIGGSYTWSVRPQHTTAHQIATAISESGTIYSLGYKDTTSYFSAVDINGKMVLDQKFQGNFCETKSLAAGPTRVYAIREYCGASHKNSVLVSIDVKTGKEARIDFAAGELEFVRVENSSAQVVFKDSAGNLMLATLPAL